MISKQLQDIEKQYSEIYKRLSETMYDVPILEIFRLTGKIIFLLKQHEENICRASDPRNFGWDDPHIR